MSHLLLVDPRQYVVNYLGYKNEKLLKIAMEIYMAENTLYPSFRVRNQDMDEKLKIFNDSCLHQYKNEYSHHFKKGILNPIYYLHYMNYILSEKLAPKYQSDLFDWFEFIGYSFLKQMYQKNDLQSNVARIMFRANEFYKGMYDSKFHLLNDSFSKNNDKKIDVAKRKIIGAMVIQNKELYELEKERVRQSTEYKIYDDYKSDINNAFKNIERKNRGLECI